MGRRRVVTGPAARLKRQRLGEPELYFGAAGVLWAGTLMRQILNTPVYDSAMQDLASWIISLLDISTNLWCWPNAGTLQGPASPFLGAAHGAAGIAMALAEWARAVGDEGTLQLSDEVLWRIYTHGQDPHGRQIVSNIEATEGNSPAHMWCHGVGGYLWCALQNPTPSSRLRRAIEWGVDQVVKTPTVGNPTYCHGLAGRLELLRMAANFPELAPKVSTARQLCVRGLELISLRKDGHIVWPCEDGTLISPEFWTGFLAPATALALEHIDYQGALLSTGWLARLATRNEP